MTPVGAIRELHRICDCIVHDYGEQPQLRVTINRFGCRLTVAGLRLVIECDRWEAFNADESKPDLLLLRELDHVYEWIVVEIKQVMDTGARRQVQAGIDKLGSDQMFELPLSAQFGGLFAYRKANRAANTDALRRSLTHRGKLVPAQVKRCSTDTIV